MSTDPIERQDLIIKIPGRQRVHLEQIKREEFRKSIGDAARSLIDREIARRSIAAEGGKR